MANRPDSLGLFWEDHKKVKTAPKQKLKREAPFPFWLEPDYLPGLEEALAFKPDLITDQELLDLYKQRDKFHLDFEVYPNYVELGLKSELTGKVLIFELYFDKSFPLPNYRKLLWICERFCFINFNGRAYDFPMLALFLARKTTLQMWQATDQIIGQRLPWKKVVRSFGATPLPLIDQGDGQLWINQIDLISLTALSPSLKKCAGRLHAKKMQDLPFKPGTWLSPEQITIIRHYNINDLNNNQLLYRSLIPQIELREQVGLEYRVDLRSLSDAQMAEAIITAEIKRRTGQTNLPHTIIEPGTIYRFEAPKFIKFTSKLMNHVLAVLHAAEFEVGSNGAIILPKSVKALNIKINKCNYQMGIGGLHSQEESVAHISDEEFVLIDTDATSYYPRLILNAGLTPENLGKDFLLVYDGIVVRRVAAKEAGDIITAECLKIVINGTFGKLGSKWSVVYAPRLLLQVTIPGQLSILMLVERFELAGIEVISVNTDGIVVKCRRAMEDKFKAIVKQWEKETGIGTEEMRYKAVYSRDINNYIAIYEKPQKGKLFKTKGVYAETAPKKNAVTEICTDAIKALLEHGTPIDHTIRACKDIRRFTAMREVDGGAVNVKKSSFNPRATEDEMRKVIMENEYAFDGKGWARDAFESTLSMSDAYLACSKVTEGDYLGEIVRWYYATGEQFDIIYADNGNKVADTDGAKACMNLPDMFPEDVDYNWYIERTTTILKQIGYYPATPAIAA